MRELGFRAYIKPLKRYATGMDTIQFHKCCDVAGAGIWSVVTLNEGIFEGDAIIVEQDTGVKDKNGRKIYENDIVKTTRSYGYGFLPKGAKAKVIFDEKELCYKLQNQGEFRLTSKKEVEIIGNVNENPELLGGEEE